jgi:ribosomal protein L14E/L6E/L27E
MTSGESIQGVDLAPSAIDIAVLAERVKSLDASRLNEVELARLDERISGLKNAFESERTSSKEGIATAFEAADKATTAALTAQKEAASKSEENAKAQLEMHNGLIRKMDSLVQGFPNKESVAKDLEARDQRLNLLDKQVARAYGVAAGAGGLAGILSVTALIISLTSHG